MSASASSLSKNLMEPLSPKLITQSLGILELHGTPVGNEYLVAVSRLPGMVF